MMLDARLSFAMDASGLMDPVPESTFDDLTQHARDALLADSVVLSVFNPPRGAHKSRAGTDLTGDPAAAGLCLRVFNGAEPLVIDALHASPTRVRAFAGVPVRTTGGRVYGALCAFETSERTWSRADLSVIAAWAACAAAAIELRLSQVTAERAVSLSEGQGAILRLIAEGRSLETTLAAIIDHVERHATSTVGSVLLLSEDGRQLRHGSAPRLPREYCEALDGVVIGNDVGSCGTAAYLGELVVVEDIATDPRWAAFKHLALAHGLRACWSQPVFASDGRVLGTFAFYYREPRRPTYEELCLIDDAAALAGIAIEREHTERTLIENATRDPLTGLWNRRAMLEHLNRRSTSPQQLAVVYFIDVDNFKHVNDTLGHHAGDQLLQALARRLERITREGDVLTRLGGDEMALFATGVGSQEEAEAFAARLLRALAVPFELAGTSLQVRVSVGVAIAEPDTSGEELLGMADKAMYGVKSDGGNAYALLDRRPAGAVAELGDRSGLKRLG